MLSFDQMCEMSNQELDAAFASYAKRVQLLRKSSEEKKAMSSEMLEEYWTFLTEMKCCVTHLDPKNRQRIEARRAKRNAVDSETIVLDGITVGKPW